MTIKTTSGEEVKIKGKNIYTPRRNLGHLKAPAGIYRAQFEAIIEKATSLNEAIDRSGSTRKETRMFYDTVWRQAIEYTLAQSFLSEKQIEAIEKKLTPLVGKCGFNRNTAYEIREGPSELGGAGFVPIKASAGSGYVLHLLKHWRSPKEDVGKVIRAVVAWTQYQAGTSYPIFTIIDTNIDYVDGRFCPATRQFLKEIQ